MTHPLFYNPEITEARPGETVYLDAESSAHAIRSMRLNTTDPVLISDGAGTLAVGVIESADPRRAGVQVEEITVQASPAVRITLVQALAKGDRDLLAAEMATEIGVDAVTPWQAQRSIVRIRPERSAKTQTKWQTKLRSAAQQSRRAFIPKLHPLVHATSIAELHAPQNGHQLIVLHEDGPVGLQTALDAMPDTIKEIHLAVGPEGGVAPDELTAVQEVGASVVKLGSTVMRASTAGPAAIAVLNQLFDRW